VCPTSFLHSSGLLHPPDWRGKGDHVWSPQMGAASEMTEERLKYTIMHALVVWFVSWVLVFCKSHDSTLKTQLLWAFLLDRPLRPPVLSGLLNCTSPPSLSTGFAASPRLQTQYPLLGAEPTWTAELPGCQPAAPLPHTQGCQAGLSLQDLSAELES
jgi:hypothetical protein